MSTIKADTFITDDFLLESDVAKTLYHDYAKKLPIIDYHNHLSPQQIAEDLPIGNITDAWLNGDHYKWRGMRANGIDENYITGTASKQDKFNKWSETVPYTLRNPLFHWTHLELKRYFNIDKILQPSTASDIYKEANKSLENKTPADLLKHMNVEVICTTDDPVDTLEYHKAIAEKNIFTKVYPTFRPDTLLLIEDSNYASYIAKLEQAVGFKILNLDDLENAIQNRIEFFSAHGCRLSDYGLEQIFAFDFTDEDANTALKLRLQGQTITKDQANIFASCVLFKLCKMYHKAGWIQQFHLGAIRNNNSRLVEEIGADAGCDSIGDFNHAQAMSKLFNGLNKQNALSKTTKKMAWKNK